MHDADRREAEWAREKTQGSLYRSVQRWKGKGGEQREELRWVAEFTFRDYSGKKRTIRDTKSRTQKAGKAALAALRDRAWKKKQPPEIELEPQTVGEYLDEWHEGRKKGTNARDGKPLADTTADNEFRHITLLKSRIGGINLRELTSDDVSKLFQQLISGPLEGKPRGQQQVYQVLSKALVDVRPRLASDLLIDVDRPRARSSKAGAFQPHDLVSILEGVDMPIGDDSLVDESFATLVHVLAHTGMRIGEAFALQWQDIDWNAGRLHVRASMSEAKGRPPQRKSTKSGDERTVPLPAAVLERLRRLKGGTRSIRIQNPLIFVNAKGMPHRRSNVLRRRWHPLLRELKVMPAKVDGQKLEAKEFGFHRLRHTYASVLLAKGIDIGTVSHLLGHASMTITLSVYGHFIPGREREAVEAFEAAIGESKATR